MRLYWVTTILLATVCQQCNGNKRLVKYLESLKYNPALRPVVDERKTTTVQVAMTLLQMREMHEKEQYLQLNAWIHLYWEDQLLTWNPKDFNGTKQTLMHHTKVWRPDLMLYNSVDEERSIGEVLPSTNVLITSSGHATWVAPALLKSSCKINVGLYPFDTQWCNLTFGSWMYHSNQMNITNRSSTVELEDCIPNGEWVLDSVTVQRRELMYSCCQYPVTEVVFTVQITRRPLFYLFHLLFPCVLLLLIGILVFCLPPESGEKVGLAITLLLSMTVFMLVVIDYIPPTSEVISVFDKFFAGAILQLSIAAGLSVMVTNLHYRGAHHARPPAWLGNLFLQLLPRMVLMENVSARAQYFKTQQMWRSSHTGSSAVSSDFMNEQRDMGVLTTATKAQVNNIRSVSNDRSSSGHSANIAKNKKSDLDTSVSRHNVVKMKRHSGNKRYSGPNQQKGSRGTEEHILHINNESDSSASTYNSQSSVVTKNDNVSDDNTHSITEDYNHTEFDHRDKHNISNSAIPPTDKSSLNDSVPKSEYWNIIHSKMAQLPKNDRLTRELLDELAEEEMDRLRKAQLNQQKRQSPASVGKALDEKHLLSVHSRIGTNSRSVSSYGENEDIVFILQDILQEMRQLQAVRKSQAKQKSMSASELEWRLIAMVSDRVCFVLFTILTVALTLYIFWPVM